MIRNLAVFVFFVLVGTSDLINSPVYSDQWAVHIEGDEEIADKIAEDHGFVNLGKIFGNYYHFMHRKVSKRSLDANQEHHENLISHPNVKWAEQQVIKSRVKRDFRVFKDVKPTKTSLNDPRWPQMWYLNRGGGLDMNVQKAWSQGVTGKGVVVTILDDGLERDHPDIKRNYDAIASFDVNNQDEDPQPRYDLIDSNRHGTRCAGEVAADANNSICAVGVAYDANVGGVRMLDGDVTDAVEARSLSLRNIHIDIYSASWGPDDDGKTVDGPGDLATKAFIEGVKNGRNGLGSIFVWASGNGGREHDNCNCDGYTNSIWTLSISSATENGLVPWYSEACSSTLATTYSSGSAGEKQVVTTDLHHGCTSTHTGTSASAPLAAGICALALQINRRLTWRDMQHIVVRTARPANLLAADWATNGVGRNVSHSFGYGLMDANAMVELAKNWTTVPEQKVCEVKAIQKDKLIPAHSEVKLDVHVDCHHILYLEHVQAKISLTATRRGDIRIFLISPMGTRSTLLDTRVHDNARNGFQAWPFMTVHCWGENPAGKWILEIHNEGRYQGRAMLHEWMLVFYGTTEDPDGEVTTSSSIPSTSLTNFLSSNSTTTTSTPSSTHVPLSHLSMAVESGGEVLDSNVLHGGLSLDPSAKQTIQNDAAKAKEWQLILYGTKEDPQQKSFQAVMNSSCIRLSASGACLECTAGLVSNGTACQKTVCPEQKFLVDEENNLTASKEKICLPCHYSCKSCLGPNDYQCLSCFGDAIYENGFCFPNNLVQQLHFFQHWQFGMTIIFFIMAVIVVILVIAVIWLRSTLTSAANYIKLQQEEDRILCAKPYTDLRIKDDATVEIFHDTEEM